MKPLSHERRILLMAVTAGLPGSLVALTLLWTGDYTPKVQWTLSVLIVGLWSGFALAVRRRVVFPLQTVSNLLAALREGDYSIRGRQARPDDALGDRALERGFDLSAFEVQSSDVDRAAREHAKYKQKYK